jgi:hypothetical protein
MPPFVIFQKISEKMAHNVPAVWNVLARPMKESAGFQGLQKCGVVSRGSVAT